MSQRHTDPSVYLTFVADNVRKRRIALGYTQLECARLLGVGHESYWRGLETASKGLSLERLIMVADVLGCKPGELLEGL